MAAPAAVVRPLHTNADFPGPRRPIEPVVNPAVFDPRLARPNLTLPVRGTLVADRYRVGDDIGEGGMSVVFSARDERLGRDVALKLLNPHLAFSQEIVTRFVNEARTLAQLDCQHVVRVFDAGVTSEPGQPPLPFMVLELLHGVELRHSAAEPGERDSRRIVGWMLQVCEGLAAAHVEGIIHRDLKPENLFVVYEGDGSQVVKVLDFGIARSMQFGASVTCEGERMGSPGYMSPEQIQNVRSVDERSDIWSLGVIMYELLAGVAPFEGENAIQLCVQILNAPVVPLEVLRPDLSPALAAVVQRCMQRPINARFANIADLADALAPHAPPTGADVAVRIRRRLTARSAPTHAVSCVRLPAAIRTAVGPPLETIQVSELPAIPLTRLRVRAGRDRYLRPLALGATAAALAFLLTALFPSASGRSRQFITTTGARLAAETQEFFGK